MRLTIKLIFILFLLLLASSLLFTHGCGKALLGHGSGGCPDSTAPTGASIVAPTSLGAPSAANGGCYPALSFSVRDSEGNPMNGICVEIFTNASIALHTGLPNCSNVVANPQASIVTRTDNSGNVVVEMATPPTAAGNTFFVEVVSGALAVEAITPAAQ